MTLIELVVALAIFVVVIVGASGALGAFFRLKSTYEQQMIVEQNFGVAVSRISQDMRVAVEQGSPKKVIVQAPANYTMGETLTVYVYNPSDPSSPTQVTYRLQGNTSTGYAVTRNNAPITENMRQLVKLYFVSDGAKVVVIMVGETTYGGKPQKTSFTSLIYTRNTGYAQQ
jgi:type II secretory pathway pseudopilin PulG